MALGSNDVVPKWTDDHNLEELDTALPMETCIVREKVTPVCFRFLFLYILSLSHFQVEIQAHSKMFICIGDLHRYRSNIANESYEAAIKSYLKAFSLEAGNGIVFNQLGVIASARNNNDRLSRFFYFLRALYATSAFQNAKEVLLSKLGSITDKMVSSFVDNCTFNEKFQISGDFSKHSELFKNPSITDSNGIFASTVKNSGPNEYYFSWFRKLQTNWKRYLSKLPQATVLKIQNDNFFHMINLLLTKQSHQTFSLTCERFLVITQHLLDDELINGLELLQITTIFILALKSRDGTNLDENFDIVARTLLYFIGLLLSKLYDAHELADDKLEKSKTADTVLPSIVVIESYWESICECLPVNVYLSPSFTFDFSIIRKKICKLGSVLEAYIEKLEISIERNQEGSFYFGFGTCLK